MGGGRQGASSRVVDRFIRMAPGNSAMGRGRGVFSVELPVKLNHTKFRGNNLLFDFDRPSDLPRPLSLHIYIRTYVYVVQSGSLVRRWLCWGVGAGSRSVLCPTDEFRSSCEFFAKRPGKLVLPGCFIVRSRVFLNVSRYAGLFSHGVHTRFCSLSLSLFLVNYFPLTIRMKNLV